MLEFIVINQEAKYHYDGYNLAEAKMDLNSLLFSQELNDIRRK